MLIALTGFAQSGKDTVAKILWRERNFTRIAFADPMREALLRLNPRIQNGSSTTALAWLVRKWGWDYCKVQFPEVRQLLQRFGTEVGREMFGESFWIEQAMKKAQGEERVVFTDCRFENEAQAVLARGGQVWRVTRPGVGPVNGHVSDAGLPDSLVQFSITNDGTLEELERLILDLAWLHAR